MDKTMADGSLLTMGRSAQPDRRGIHDRRAASRGGRRATDAPDLPLAVSMRHSSTGGYVRTTWVFDRDILEELPVH